MSVRVNMRTVRPAAVQRAALAALVVVGLGSQAALAAVFSNGSFEQPVVQGAVQVLSGDFLPGLTGGWQSMTAAGANGSNSLYQYNPDGNNWVKTSNGVQLLALNSAGTGGIQQVFDTTAGLTYQVSFDYSAISTGGNQTYHLAYEVDNGSTALDAAMVTPVELAVGTTGLGSLGMPNYATETFSFVAASSSSTIRFVSLEAPSGAFGTVIDNVSITVPEPAGLALLGIVAPLVLRRSRRNSIA